MRHLVLLLLACGIAPLTGSMVEAQASLPAAQPAKADVTGAVSTADSVDPYLWLEDVDGARAMAWVNAENAKTLKVLENDPRYPDLHAAALKVAETQDRIPIPRFLASDIYNFWQDAEHVRGLWRKTSLADYRNPTPQWIKVLDLDALEIGKRQLGVGRWRLLASCRSALPHQSLGRRRRRRHGPGIRSAEPRIRAAGFPAPEEQTIDDVGRS